MQKYATRAVQLGQKASNKKFVQQKYVNISKMLFIMLWQLQLICKTDTCHKFCHGIGHQQMWHLIA